MGGAPKSAAVRSFLRPYGVGPPQVLRLPSKSSLYSYLKVPAREPGERH